MRLEMTDIEKISQLFGGPEVQKRILIVEDNIHLAELLENLLHAWGHTVKTTNDGISALKEFNNFNPEIVLLDIGLPGIDGYAVAAELRFRSSSLVIIGISGYVDYKNTERLHKIGFNHHLIKPFDFKVLKELVSVTV